MIKHLDKKYILIILIVVLFEIFVCNYRSIKSSILNYNEIAYNESSGANIIDTNGDGKQIEIEIKDINTKIYNIYIDYKDLYPETQSKTIVEVDYTDKLFSGYSRDVGSYRKLEHNMIQQYDKTKYIHCDFTGDSEKILLTLKNDLGIRINSITINKKVPFEFNFVRAILLILFIAAIYTLLKKEFFKKKYDINDKDQNIVLLLLPFLFIIILSLVQQTIGLNTDLIDTVFSDRLYGQEFVLAIINGHIDINKYNMKLLEDLNNAENPYDFNAPERHDIYNDSAYFNGNLYMYYGILPALLLLVPTKLIIGEFLSMDIGTFIFLSIGAIFTVKLFSEIIYRFYKKVPFCLVVLLCTFVLFNNKILWTMSRPCTYEFVISAGYCFVMAGMYYFFKYLRTKKMPHLFVACLLIALSVACRPTCLVASIYVFARLIYDLIHDIKNKKVNLQYIVKLILCMIPYLVVGTLLMTYNYVRFGNIFEFGANYQISVTDFRNLGFNINRAIIGITTFLFSPIKLCSEFPFVISENFMPEYMGYYYSQPIGGGYFTVTIIGAVILLLPWLWKKAKEYSKEMNALIILSISVGMFLILFESNKCGSLGRYMMDFAWMLNIATVLLILLLYENIKNQKNKSMFIKLLLALIVLSCIINTLLIYSNENSLLETKSNLNIYYYIKYLFSF